MSEMSDFEKRRGNVHPSKTTPRASSPTPVARGGSRKKNCEATQAQVTADQPMFCGYSPYTDNFLLGFSELQTNDRLSEN